VKKSDKMALWNNLEELLPPPGSGKAGNDAVGLISLVDRAYNRAYKLHKVYNSAMRFHCAARWVATLERTLAQSAKGTGWKRILTSLAQSEYGNYQLEADRITRIAPVERIRDGSLGPLPPPVSLDKSVTGTLF
jgi:hypothetical protein